MFMAGWWFGTWLSFSPIVGMMIQSDELHHFSEGLKPHQVDSGKSHDVYLVGGLEPWNFMISIYWDFHHPN